MTEDILYESKYPVCLMCKHLKKNITCEAFPNGIPEDIVGGTNDHSQKHPDQENDIVFEKIENKKGPE